MAQQDQPSASNANKASEENPPEHPLRRESEPGQPPNAPQMSFSDTVTTANLPKSLHPNNIPPRRPLELNTSPTAGPTQSSRNPLQPITPELFSRSFYGNVKTPRGVRPPSRPAPQHRSPSTSDTHHKQAPITETEREASKKKTRRHEIEATKAAIAALREKLARLTPAAAGADGGKSAWAAVRGPGKAEAAGTAGAERKSAASEDERAAFVDAKMGGGTSRAGRGRVRSSPERVEQRRTGEDGRSVREQLLERGRTLKVVGEEERAVDTSAARRKFRGMAGGRHRGLAERPVEGRAVVPQVNRKNGGFFRDKNAPSSSLGVAVMDYRRGRTTKREGVPLQTSTSLGRGQTVAERAAEEGMNGKKKSGSSKVEIAQGYRDNAFLKIPRRKGGKTATNSSTPSILETE